MCHSFTLHAFRPEAAHGPQTQTHPSPRAHLNPHLLWWSRTFVTCMPHSIVPMQTLPTLPCIRRVQGWLRAGGATNYGLLFRVKAPGASLVEVVESQNKAMPGEVMCCSSPTVLCRRALHCTKPCWGMLGPGAALDKMCMCA